MPCRRARSYTSGSFVRLTSRNLRSALKYAASMAQEADGQLTVLHVVAHEFENAADMASISAQA